MLYEWKDGKGTVDPQVAGELFARLSAEGELTTAKVVDLAKDSNHPLHKCFEWNDSIAGHAYRKQQAARLIRAIVVVKQKPKAQNREFVLIKQEKEAARYCKASVVAKDDGLYLRALSEARIRADAANNSVKELLALRKSKTVEQASDHMKSAASLLAATT
jgi:hypothetical protein